VSNIDGLKVSNVDFERPSNIDLIRETLVPVGDREVPHVRGHVLIGLTPQAFEQPGTLGQLTAPGTLWNHQHELACSGVVKDERYLDEFAIFETVQRAPERRRSKIRVLGDVDDPKYLDFQRLTIWAEHPHKLDSSTPRGPLVWGA
jgi:hypothetical protein